ncbi:MAG: N-acetylmuramoyl-L-alanine amidase [Pseudomonadota bacterium]
MIIASIRRILLIALLWLGAAAHAQTILDVRVVGDGDPTRITLWSDVPLSHDLLLKDIQGSKAIVLRAPGAIWGAPERSRAGMGGVASASWQDGAVLFRLDRAMMVSRALNLPPAGSELNHRIVLDLRTVSPVRFARAAQQDERRQAPPPAINAAYVPPASPSVEPRRTPSTSPIAPAGRRIVVIDPGHGGKDPGASHHGAVEKTIVLKSALDLRDRLEATGRYTVRLTRDDDTFIELEDRVTLARNWGADLFISIHADSARSADVSGASVYTLSQRGEGRVDREAAENNWRLPIEDVGDDEVEGILSDLLKRETKTKSSEFAGLLLPELGKAGPLVRNSHRNAGFYVLLAPDVPAVLVELGFLTNRADAKRLRSKAGRDRSMAAITRAVDIYFAQQDRLLASD